MPFSPEKGPSSVGKPEAGEGRENEPSQVFIYATEFTKTMEDRVSKQGFGSSTPLETPLKTITYHWEGKLHPTEYERQNPSAREGYAGSSNAHADLKVLAENFSLNFLDRQNPELQKQNKASYSLGFGPSRKIKQEFEEKRGSQPQNKIIRGLTSDEQEVFMEAFKMANEEAIKRKKKSN